MSEELSLMVRDDAKMAAYFSEAANTLRDAALEQSALVGKVSNPKEQEVAVKSQIELKRLIQEVEKARKAAKEPILTFGRAVDSAASKFVAELDAELQRVTVLVSNFQQLEAMKLRAAEQARNEQLLQIERDRAAALAKAASHDEADAINEKFSNEAAQLPVREVPRVSGQMVRGDWEVKVTDIWLLARAHPTCVKIEPRLSEIKELLKMGVKLQGVTATPITNATVKVPNKPALEA